MANADLLISNIGQLLTCANSGKPKRKEQMQDVGLIRDAAVAVRDGSIVAAGKMKELEDQYTAKQVLDAQGKAVCPGFVDPHTHLIFAGDRIAEFEMRLRGASYLDIMAAGGGIAFTAQATQKASLEQLIEIGKMRLDQLLELGTTTVEIKSGYGLESIHEIKILEAAVQCAANHVVDVVITFLGAHAVPQKYRENVEGYVDLVIHEMLPMVKDWWNKHPEVEKLYNDVFLEKGAFSLEQSRQILESGKHLGLLPKLHADEFTSMGGVKLAVELGATSVDHLDVTSIDDIRLLAESDTVAVVLPAVNFNLGSTTFAPARDLIDHGAILALASDYNPGSAPCLSMPLVMAIACRYQRLTPAEALNASTINAAFAIGMETKVGSIEAGKQADLLLLEVQDYRHLAYQFGTNQINTVIKKGKVVYTKK